MSKRVFTLITLTIAWCSQWDAGAMTKKYRREIFVRIINILFTGREQLLLAKKMIIAQGFLLLGAPSVPEDALVMILKAKTRTFARR